MADVEAGLYQQDFWQRVHVFRSRCGDRYQRIESPRIHDTSLVRIYVRVNGASPAPDFPGGPGVEEPGREPAWVGVWRGRDGRRSRFEVKMRVLLAVLSWEMSGAEAARRHGVSDMSVSKWKQQFLEAGCQRL
ncbi:helix-turn-helix domain-containing protein [Prescottella equi]|uniref:helix-turn-helix domain-containing protein n=1 Tax=Rhodococcus hoagii TaxID=43767 RepID=UPI003080BA08